MANLELPFSVKVLNALPVDAKFMNGNVPYTSIAEANSILNIGIRHPLLVVNINNVEYHYKDGITDAHLVIKTIDVSGKAEKLQTIIKDEGISRTLSITDLDKNIVFTGINPTTLILPTNESKPLPIGFRARVTSQSMSGIVSVSAPGITIISDCGTIQGIGETRIYVKIDTNTWTITGNVSLIPYIKSIGSSNISVIWKGTKDEYLAIVTKNSSTIYNII